MGVKDKTELEKIANEIVSNSLNRFKGRMFTDEIDKFNVLVSDIIIQALEFGKQEARKELTRENIKGFKDAQRYESGFLKSLFKSYKGELYFQSDSINRIKQRIKQLEGVKRK